MKGFLTLIFGLLLSAQWCLAQNIQQPDISLMYPQGIRFAYPAEGVNMVSYHYSINVALQGAEAGEYNYDVNTPTDGYFVSENTQVLIQPTDVVYYWINVIKDTGGYSLFDQSWTPPPPTTTTKVTTTTTEKPTTTTKPAVPTTTEDKGDAEVTTKETVVATTEGTVVTQDPGTGSGSGTSSGPALVCDTYPCDNSCDQSVPPCNGLIFDENWDELDLTRWQHEITLSGGGNWEFEYYTNNRTNSYVKDNTLFIKPTLTSDHYGEAFLSSGTLDVWGSQPADLCTSNAFWGCSRTGSGSNYLNPIQSARLRTVHSFSFKYGYIEVEAKLPKGDWIWPAIWLLPTDQDYGIWPASGEIDIVESRGNAPNTAVDSQGTSHGCDEAAGTMHWGPYYGANGYEKSTQAVHLTGTDYNENFHKFAVNWTENSVQYFYDGNMILEVDPGDAGFWDYGEFDTTHPNSFNPWQYSTSKMAPFDRRFFIILNVAVGGTNGYFPDNWSYTGGKPWSNTGSTAFRDFWNARSQWYPTWQGEDAALQVKRIQVWAN